MPDDTILRVTLIFDLTAPQIAYGVVLILITLAGVMACHKYLKG